MKKITASVFVMCCLLVACVPLNPAEMTCEEVGTRTVGMVLESAFAKYEILKVFAPTEVNRNSDELICEGEAMFSSGPRRTIQMRLWADEDGDTWLNVDPLE